MENRTLPGLRRRVVHAESGLEAVLSWYGPRAQMPEHAHDRDQHSLVLSGAIREVAGGRLAEPGAMTAGFKAAGAPHANEYGPNGALVLAFNVDASRRPADRWIWRRIPRPETVAPLARTLTAGDADAGDVAADLLAELAHDGPAPRRSRPPGWLSRIRCAVRDDPDGADISMLAREAGVHRVHLSRAYADAFGAPISVERRRARQARAVEAMLEESASAAAASAVAGFSDQAHFTRSLSGDIGLTPGRLARLMG